MKHLHNIVYRQAVFIFAMLVFMENASSQCSSTGAQSASVFSSQSFTGSDFLWNNPANAATSDNIRAIATDTLTLLVGRTGYLKAKGFGFGLSSYAGVCGIEVQIEKSASNILGLATVQDYEVKLLKNDVAVGNNKASGTNWTNSDSYYTYGGSNDL